MAQIFMFRTYLTTEAGEMLTWSLSETSDAINAAEAFVELLSWDFLDGHAFLIWATFDENCLACHWSRSSPGDLGYWRDKVTSIDWLKYFH